MKKKSDQTCNNRVEVGSVSMPTSLANGFFAQAIAESQNQFRTPPNYILMVNAYFDTSNIQLKKFYCSQMEKIRLQADPDVQEYLSWFEKNLDRLEKKDFGDTQLYQDSCKIQIL